MRRKISIYKIILIYTSIVASIYPADKKDFRLNPYRVFGVNGAESRY